MSFPYKHVLLIGATAGIGQAMAIKLVETGVKVTAVGRRKDRLDAFVGRYEDGKAKGVVFDVEEWEKAGGFAELLIMREEPDIDCIFLNAGVQNKYDVSKPESVSMAMVKKELDINFTGMVALANAFLPTGSHLGIVPAATLPFYSASKAALNAYTLCLREQLKASGSKVKVVEIFPPPVQTELHNYMGKDIGPKLGMPLDVFTETAYKGLCTGEDEVLFVSGGIGKEPFEEILGKRRTAFEKLAKIMGGGK